MFRPLALLCALLLASCDPVGTPKASAVLVAPAQTAVQVVGVTDGDTLAVLMDGRQVKVRIHGIDAPEKGQLFGDVAKRALSDLVFRKEVDLNIRGKDLWGRSIARVWVNEQDVGARIGPGRDGMALCGVCP